MPVIKKVKLERDYQGGLKKRICARFPGSYVFKLDSGDYQGIPDLMVIWGPFWGILEVKREKPTKPSDYQPNQEWYIDQLNQMSFSSVIYPENEEAVLDELQQAFTPRRQTRYSLR